MAGFSGARPIIVNGLIFIIDPSNKECYESGNTFHTVSKDYRYTGNMYNGITFTNEGSGSFLYDGTNEHASISATNANNFRSLLLNNFSALIWCKPQQISGIASRIFGLGYVNQWQFEMRGGAGTRFTINYKKNSTNYFLSNGPNVSFDTWQQTGFVVDNGVIKHFVNGEFTGHEHTIVGDGNFEEGNQPYSYGNYNTSTDGRYNGYLSHHAVYNRVLSANEILENYNSLKGRFGL